MLRLTKKQHKPYSFLYSWITSMADIPETVLLSQPVCIGLTQPSTLEGRSRWFLSYIATVPHMNLYVMLDRLKVNFLQIPSMFTTIPHKTRNCWYQSQKFRLLHQIPVISPAESVHGWWEQNDKCHIFLLYHNIQGYDQYTIVRHQKNATNMWLKDILLRRTRKNCTVAKCEVSWTDSTVHDVRGYIGCNCGTLVHYKHLPFILEK